MSSPVTVEARGCRVVRKRSVSDGNVSETASCCCRAESKPVQPHPPPPMETNLDFPEL